MTKKTPQAPKFKLGQTASWTSQSGGHTSEKVGIVEEVVPAGKYPSRERFSSLYTGAGVGSSRDHVSYVIRVKGRGVYWPRVSGLVAAQVAADSPAKPTASKGISPAKLLKLADAAGISVGSHEGSPYATLEQLEAFAAGVRGLCADACLAIAEKHHRRLDSRSAAMKAGALECCEALKG